MKVAIVTGVAGGIGRACALALAEKGYAIVGMGRSQTPDLADFEGLDLTYVSGNISCAEDRKRLVDAALSKGGVAVLVNVAGIAPPVRRDLLEMTEESYDLVMGINTKGTLFLTQTVANEMIKAGKGGSIVNISSCSAYTSSTSRGEYCISKAGVSMITKLFADRLATEGITVNEICPGIIETDMTAGVKEKYDKLIAEGLVPMGRWGTPRDIAKIVLALCDGTFGYTTGETIIADGGMHIRKL
jgi:NAD(P)-dependent dehydrogenase (short-subunit alcohol dehydrogenase family)